MIPDVLQVTLFMAPAMEQVPQSVQALPVLSTSVVLIAAFIAVELQKNP